MDDFINNFFFCHTSALPGPVFQYSLYISFISKPVQLRKPELSFLIVKKSNLCIGNFWKSSASLPLKNPPSLKAKNSQTDEKLIQILRATCQVQDIFASLRDTGFKWLLRCVGWLMTERKKIKNEIFFFSLFLAFFPCFFLLVSFSRSLFFHLFFLSFFSCFFPFPFPFSLCGRGLSQPFKGKSHKSSEFSLVMSVIWYNWCKST